MIKLYETTIDNQKYNINITKSYRYKNINLRFKNNGFYVNAPLFSSDKEILAFIESCKERLIKKVNKKKLPYDNEGVYIFGKYVRFNEGFIMLNNKYFLFKDIENFYKIVKKEYLLFFKKRVRSFENIMNISTSYNVRLKTVGSIYGSNSKKTHSITINTKMIHYDIKIIDALIVHELAHHFERNHGANFYKIILRYIPNYYELDKKLMKGIYE